MINSKTSAPAPNDALVDPTILLFVSFGRRLNKTNAHPTRLANLWFIGRDDAWSLLVINLKYD